MQDEKPLQLCLTVRQYMQITQKIYSEQIPNPKKKCKAALAIIIKYCEHKMQNKIEKETSSSLF